VVDYRTNLFTGIRVLVRMVLKGQLPVGLLDLVSRGILAHLQYGVEVNLGTRLHPYVLFFIIK